MFRPHIPTVEELANGTIFLCSFAKQALTRIYTGPSPRYSYYAPEDTVLFYGFVIPRKVFNPTIHSLYRELVNTRIDPASNGFASLDVSDSLRIACGVPTAAFRPVRRSREQPTEMMMCIGSNLKPFSLSVSSVNALAKQLGVEPSSAEWCFSNRMRHSFYGETESTDEESTDDDSTNGPVTDEELVEVATIDVSDGQEVGGLERGGEGGSTELVEKTPYVSK